MRLICLFFSILCVYTAAATTIYYVNDGDLSYKWIDISKEQRMEWIDLEENTPKIGQFIIGTDGCHVGECIFYPNDHFQAVNLNITYAWEKVTHWMPLPNPPSFKDGND